MIRATLAASIALVLSSCGNLRTDVAARIPDGDAWKANSDWHGRASVDPGQFDRLLPASDLRRRNFPSWVEQGGAGIPGVLWRSDSDEQKFVTDGGTAIPVTYFVNGASIDLYDVLESDHAVIGGRRTQLAANFTAPLAYMQKQSDLALPVIRAMIKNDKYIDETGLHRFEPVDTNRIPVIFVHGIKSNVSIWRNMVNELRADRLVREEFQFWAFQYPTGVPMLYSGMRLRRELERMQQTYNPGGIHPRMNRMVIIGHSMGGLVTELQIKDSGDAFWPEGRPAIDGLGLAPEQKQLLSDSVSFEAIPQIRRAIFISTPHRGSDFAETRVGDVLSRIIRLPADITGAALSLVNLDPFFAKELDFDGHIPNSIDDMEPGSDFLVALRGIPFEKGVGVHSIISLGEKPADPITESYDGLVRYKSAHLEEADSELALASGHRAQNHPGAIREVVRILHLHLKEG